MSKILVTGGAGFIGSHLVEELVNRGHDVVALDDLSGGFVDNVVEGARFVKADITDVETINDLFAAEQFEYVYHLAAYAAEGLSHFIKHFNYTNNLIGSVNLINASINTDVKCFVFTSSIAVYGTSAELPMTEETIPHPEDSYGVAKLAVEHELAACKEMFDLNYVVFRPHNVYGERQNIGDKYRNVVGIFMNQLLQGKPMSVFGDGSQSRAFSYIGDMTPIMADAIHMPEAYNQVFNIGADTPYSVNDLATAVAKAMNIELDLIHLPARNEVWHAYSSHAKVQRVFGERPLTSLDDGLKRMADWVKQHGARSSSEFGNIEVTKNFPKAWLLQKS
ncbi:MAG: NAD-dependent epimerase/dehydratase family protein [Ardenticatenaceae bacterium]|nr:NAD-dependent epimerase/dehydratase family protein [Anaerolineales bacterium]MCB8923773.1 NAD-dependent epimerase/dehydratase family protein [Ardenticatenaceae bacterium]MCB8990108.1 NAD-dependent epimerase/dehydratase family protein [Ardenticatenaceae bacterium]